MGRKVLVVVSDTVDPARLTEALSAELEPDCTIKVVGSPSLSRLEWLTNDEDGARREAQQLAETGAQAIDGQTEPTPGDPIPEQAAEDALRTFPAEEVVFVTPSGTELDLPALEGRHVAVRRITLPATD